MIRTEKISSEQFGTAVDPLAAVQAARGGNWEPMPTKVVSIRVIDVAADQVVLTMNLPVDRTR